VNLAFRFYFNVLPLRWIEKEVAPIGVRHFCCSCRFSCFQTLRLRTVLATSIRAVPLQEGGFDFNAWIRRGTCIHNLEDYDSYRTNLQLTLSGLDSLHSAEYSASATILTLLPTIGAVFGTPTAEIWILLNVLPFGGAIAILLSFGGSMMPAKPEEYDDDATRGEGQRPDNVAGQKEAEANGPSDPFERLSRIVANKVQAHLRRKLPLLKIFYLALRHDSNAVWSLGRHWNRRVRFGLHNLVYIYLVVSPMVYYPVSASIFTNWRQLIDFFSPFMVLHLLNCEANLLTYSNRSGSRRQLG
jgi:hypothetical protein